MLFKREVCRLLAEDPELGALIPEDQRPLAFQACETPVTTIAAGTWGAPEAVGHFGYLILSGVIARRVQGGDRSSCELLGDGDLLRPDASDDGVVWTVLEEAELACLDARFTACMHRWPQIADALLERCLARAHALAEQLAILSAHPVDRRLLMMLWHLAERWGRVGPQGVRLPLPLTHGMLAEMSGVRRPSLSTAVGSLVDGGRLARPNGDRGWLLIGPAPTADGELLELSGAA